MSAIYRKLSEIQRNYKEFCDSTVCAAVGEDNCLGDDLGFYELAIKIKDRQIQKEYCDIAIQLLNANIAYEKPWATKITPKQSHTIAVVSTLMVAAFTLKFGDLAFALLAASLWYWIVATISYRDYMQKIKASEELNDSAEEWAEKVKEKKKEREKMLDLRLRR